MSTTSYFRSAAILSLILVGSLSATAAPPQAKRKIITHVRFVRIELPGENKILSLAEVQVVRGGRNIAPNGVASQSGAEQGALAGRAIDSNTSGNFNEGTVTHTPASENPWWELDLGKPQSVESITVWNRTDCCPERLEGFTIKLLDGRRKLLHERKGLRAPRPRTARRNHSGPTRRAPHRQSAPARRGSRTAPQPHHRSRRRCRRARCSTRAGRRV